MSSERVEVSRIARSFCGAVVFALMAGAGLGQGPAEAAPPPVKDWAPKAQEWKKIAHAVTKDASSTSAVQVAGDSSLDKAAVPVGRVGRLEAPSAAMPQTAWRPVGATGVSLLGATSASVEVAEQAVADRLGIDGVVVSVAASPATKTTSMQMRLDYSEFQQLAGGDYGSRVQLVKLPSCALSTPEQTKCQDTEPVAEVDTGHDASHPRIQTRLAATASSQVFALTSDASGSQGSFDESPLSSSSSWSDGDSTGGFTWSYPIDVPSLGDGNDVVPEVGLGYSSAAVDGRIASSNNQAGWIGQGWDHQPGFIERSYLSCRQDPTGKAPKKNDLCWSGEVLHLSFGSRSAQLVKDDTTGQWHPKHDDGTRVERLEGADNGALKGEHWKLTTPDGVQYFFGRGHAPGEQANTSSTWTVPVYGAKAGDPCYSAKGFADSRCVQGWRWNLDYVQGTRGEAMVNYYTAETNRYKANATTMVDYTRGGVLQRTEYGRHLTGQTLTPAAAKIVYTTAERCIPGEGFDCAEAKFTAANAKHWPDTPQDLDCATGSTCKRTSPSFWSRKRLTKISTYVVDKGKDVLADEYALNQTFPSTGEPSLWLSGITHTGYSPTGEKLSEAPVTFTGTLLANRVDGYKDMPPMYFWRLSQVHDETGRITQVSYSAPECSKTNLPDVKNLSGNTKRCFPAYWTPPYEDKPELDFFHRYVVTEVRESDPAGQSPNHVTNYRYVGAPAWHFDDNELVKPAHRTWGEFRGYGQVDELTGDPKTNTNGQADKATLTSTWYLRGMHDDKQSTGANRTVSVKNSLGDSLTDTDEFAGMAYQVKTYQGDGGTALSTQLEYPQLHSVTARQTRTGLPALTATRVVVNKSVEQRHSADATTSSVTTASRFDDHARPVATTQTADQIPTVCSTSDYADNTQANLLGLVTRTASYEGTCPATGTPTGKLLNDERLFYDNAPHGTIGAHADVTRTEKAVTAGDYASADLAYDDAGRLTTTTAYADSNRTQPRTRTTTYTLTDTGRVEAITTADQLGNSSTQHFDLFGNQTKTSTSTGLVSEADYDPLGRMVRQWQPGMPRTGEPSVTYAYRVDPKGLEAITTQARVTGDNDKLSTRTSVQLYDALGQLIQTQQDAVGGGRIVDDRFYDSHGWPVRSNNHWFTDGSPSTTRITAADTAIASRTITAYDGAGRATLSSDYTGTTLKRQTSTVHGGNTTTVLPPAGATATTEITDALGRVVKHLEYTARPTIKGNTISGGSAVSVTYTYDAAGQKSSMKDAKGATWSWEHDLAGRTIASNDPDSGRSSTRYNHLNDVLSTTDARGPAGTLNYTYDQIGRRTQIHRGLDNKLLGTWSYDSQVKGLPDGSTTYLDGDPKQPLTQRTTGYDAYNRPTGGELTIPASQGKLAGKFSSKFTYTVTGQLKTESLPAAGGLPAETLTYAYNQQGLPASMTGADRYVGKVIYNPYGQTSQLYSRAQDSIAHNSLYDPETLQLNQASLYGQTARPQIIKTNYQRNQAGQITGTTTEMGYNQTPAVRNACYAYDALGRLTEHWTSKTACGKTPSAKDNTMVGGVMPTWRSWTFDNAGSRTSQTIHALPGSTKPQESTTYSIGAPGHAHATTAETTTAGAAKTTTKYGYDIAGNTTAIEGPTGKKIIGWDAHGAVTSVLNGGKTTTYLRDIDGNIIIRRDPTGTSLYIGSSEVRDTNGTLTGLRTYNLAGQPVAQRTTTGGIYSMFTDQVGTGITAVSWNDLTKTTWRIEDPYGNQLGLLKGPWPTDRTYLDKSTDPATGLVQTGARLYNPNTGRFLSVDPILDATDALSLNGYSYSSGDPVNYSDPTGLSLWDSIKHGASKAKHALGSVGKTAKKYITNPISHAYSKAKHFVGKVYRGAKNTAKEFLRSPAKFIKNTTAGAVNWAYTKFKKLSKGVALADDLAHDRAAFIPHRGIVTTPTSSTAAVNHFFGKLDQHQRTAEFRAGIDRTSNAYRHVGPFIAESIAITVITRGGMGGAVRAGSSATGRTAESSLAEVPRLSAVFGKDGAITNMSKWSARHSESGLYDVIGHGSPNSLSGMSAEQLAAKISTSANGKDIRLLSCRTACPSGSFAQDLANTMGVRVLAPTTDIGASGSGKTLTVFDGGEWLWFSPK